MFIKAKATELKKIKNIEKIIGQQLTQYPIYGIWHSVGYSCDAEGNIIGLNLNGNQITALSPLSRLINLSELYLDNNQISDLSPLSTLTNLTDLRLYKNQISDISPLFPLKKLKFLLLMDNKISRLPIELTQLNLEIKWKFDGASGIFLEGNPLENPPVEIVKQGDAAVRNYFKEIEKEKETVLLLHAKLLLVGSGAVGKTSLMKKLKDDDFMVEPGKEPTTHGINIVPWELRCTFADGETHPVKINLWDFGGQDIMYSTHQFFLTKRSLYLFVWEARQEGQETASFEYWLNVIKLLSDNSPVIIVMNKSDARTQTIDEASIQNKFGNTRAFHQVSCLSGKGIPELREQIRSCLSRMKHLLDKLPKTWMEIRSDLEKLDKNFITLEEYIDVCRKHKLDRERAGFLSDYLHDLGVILHFKREPLLENTVILDPEWATSAVYNIMDRQDILENKGRFYYYELEKYWDTWLFPADKHPLLLRLMEKFELCYPVMGTEIHIVPELLPAQRPDMDIDKYTAPGSLRLEIHYEFMPRGILSRFICRLYYLIVEEHFWKTGVELSHENTFALVQSLSLDRKLTVSVIGANKSELLAIAKSHLEEIHRTLNMKINEHYREMIPCTCAACAKTAKPYLFGREVLINFIEKSKTAIACQVSAEDMNIQQLLKGYAEPPQQTNLDELLPTLIKTASQLQGIAKTIRSEEDSRTTYIAQILTIRGYIVKEQVKRGSSPSGKSRGELDILVENPDGTAVSVIEAFNLTGNHTDKIDSHNLKIFDYDASGLKNNFILVYAEISDFTALWKEYLKQIPAIDFKHKLLAAPTEENTHYADIKLARAVHKRHDREINVYHLFVNMKI